MSYVEFTGTLCSSEVSGGEKTFTIPSSTTGYYAYTVTVTTYKCTYATCLGGFDYTIHVVIRETVTGQIVYSDEWKVPFNPGQKTTTTFTVYFQTPLQPNTEYSMTWWAAQVDSAGGCFGVGCILCADIDMLLWQVTATPTPTHSPIPTASPYPSPIPIPSPPIPSTVWTWLLIGLVAGLAVSFAVAIAKQLE